MFSSLGPQIAYLKANEGKLNYGSSGNGTSSHLSSVMFELASKTKMTHIPFRSTGEVVNSMLGGNIDLAIDSMTTTWPFATAGSVRALAVTTPQRSPICRPSARRSRATRRPPGRGCSRRRARRLRSSTGSRRR